MSSGSVNTPRQYTQGSALGIYNQGYEVLGLDNDLNRRIGQVLRFTTATEKAYDRLATDLRSVTGQRG
jgi:hypothetical protein